MARLAILDGNDELTPQVIYSQPNYTVISRTDKTVWVEDENGNPAVFTVEQWEKMQGKGHGGGILLAAIAIVAGIMIFKGV